MNSKRIISLILSIIMTLQIFVFQTPVHAMEGANPTIQKSKGQKINERTEEFAFKNTKKPKLSWFSGGSKSLFGARNVSTTRTETLKITTKATGLDEGAKKFDWAAFGQNKKFTAWIEVAYEEDKKPGETVATERHRVSEDFEISAEGDINTTATLDASKTVDYYFLKTEYDTDDAAFKINAVLEYVGSLSPKGTNKLEFNVDIHQIVSTKITYNLIDEYGKAIDLNDTKEEKPGDDDLKGIGKIGEDISFDLKKDGKEILWQEQGLDEWNLMSSSLAMTLSKNEIKSNNIDYKLTSTYDVLNGGKVTIQRQKDVVTPKDPQKPGDIPEGYARLNLSADATGAGPTGTFTKDDSTDNRRVVDVRAGKPYTSAQAEVNKVTKPIPLTSENKEDAGKTFKAWAPELSTLGIAANKETRTLNATYESSKVEIIPYLPGEPEPKKDKGGLPIPTDYVKVTFKSESAAKGKVKIDDKQGETVLAKVKPGIDLSKKAEITTIPETDYGFTKWDPALGIAADKQIYTAYFIKSGDKINEGDPIPKDWFKVTVSQDESIKDNTVEKAIYTVQPGDKLSQDKFADISKAAKDGYKDPAWYVGSEKLDKPYEREIQASTDFLASATEEIANKFKTNGLKAVDITAYKGDQMGPKFWNKGVTTQREDASLQRTLAEATVTDITEKEGQPAKRTTDNAGTFPGTLKVEFTDGSSLEVNNQKLIVIDTNVDIDYDKENDKDANAPRHKDEVVKGKIKSDEILEGAKVEILDSENNVIGITLANADGSFIAGTRELQAGETIKVRVTLPKAGKPSPAVEKIVKLNPDRLNQLLPIAKAQKDSFSKKQNAIIKERLDALNKAITEAEKLVDENGKAKGTDTAENQTAIDNAVTALEEALKKLTANIPPSISGPKTHEIFVGEALDLKALVEVTDGDGADDLVVENGSNVKVEVKKVEGQTESPVADLSTIKDTVGTYKVTYTAKDNAGAEVTHEMTLTVKPRTNSAIEVTKDPSKMSYLITEKDGKAQLNLEGMTLNLVDNLGKKTPVQLTDSKVKLKVNGRDVTNGADLTLADDVKFIEVEYTPEGSQTPLKAQTKGVLRVGPDYDKDGTDDRTQDFDAKNIEKLEVIKQPKLDYIAKDKSEADKVFKLNLEGMIVRMTDKAGKEKLALVKEGKFVDYDEPTKEITVLTATPAHGATLTPETSATETGHNGKTVEIKSTNGKTTNTDKLKVFYDANKDGTPDHKDGQKTPAPSAMARNVGDNPQGTTVEGMATPGAVIKITNKDGAAFTTEPTEVKAGPDGKYQATIPLQADGTDIKVTAKLGEMGESDPTTAKVFDDKNDNKQPDRDEGFNIAKATDIKFVDQPDLTYLVKTKDTEVTFNGKDGKGKAIYLELSYKNGKKTESKIMTLEDLMKDNEHIAVTPANGTTDKKENQTHELVGKAIEVKLKNVVEKQGATEDQKTAATATSTSKFAIEIDADGNKIADKDETTPSPTAKALNVGKEPKSTTITGKAEKGAKVVAMVGNVKVGETTADQDGNYTIEAKKDGAALPVDTKVEVTAQVGEKQTSKPTEAIVKEDKDSNGTPDNEQGFDITKAAKIEMVSDPNKMDYLVTTQDGTVKFDATGMLVRVTDKAGKEKLYTAAELTADTTNFKVEPAHNSDLTIKANHDKKVKVTLITAPADMTTKEVETTGNLSVKLDANNNGIADEKEKFDIAKTTKVTIIQDPSKMNYLVTTKDGKKPFETAGVVIKLEDASGKTVTYNAEELKNLTDKIKLSPAEGEQLGLDNGKTKTTPFKVTVIGAEAQTKPTAIGGNVKVQLDADGNNIADEDEESAMPENIKAMNQNVEEGDPKKVTDKEKTTTTVTGKVKPGATVKITSADGKTDLTPSKIDIDSEGNFTAEIEKQAVGTKIKVWATEPGKKISKPAPADVFRDSDNNGEDDSKAGVTERPAAIASNVGSKPTFTTIKGKTEKGAVITVTVKVKGEEKPVTVENFVNNDGEYTLEAKYNGKPLENSAEILVYAQNAPKKISEPQTTTVFNDFNNDGKPDGGKVDLEDVKDIQVIAPDKMSYTQGDKLVGTGLKAIVRDNKGGIEIFDYDNTNGVFKNSDNEEVKGVTAKVADKTIKDLALTEKDHNGKAIDVTIAKGIAGKDEAKGSTNQTLEVKQLQTPTPTIEFAANQNTLGSDGKTPTGTAKQKTTVKFTVKNKPTTVYVKYTVNGEDKEESFDIGADDELTKTVDLKVKLPIGADVEVLAKDADKLISDAASAKVVRDSNNDGKDDGKKALGEPVIEDIKAGSESITVTPPEGATKLVISETDKDGKTPQGSTPITVTKGKDGNWKIGDTPVEKTEDGKLIIPNPEDDKKLKLDEYNVVKVDAEGDKDTTTPSKAVKTVGEAADTDAPAKPKVDQPVDGDKDIKVKTPTEKDAKTITVKVTIPAAPAAPGEEQQPDKVETITVTKDGENWKIGDTPVKEENGKLVIPVDPPVKTGDKVTVEVKDESGNGSKSDPIEVIARQKLPQPTINPIKTGGKTVAGTAKDAATVDIYKKNAQGGYDPIAKDVGVSPDGSYTYNNADGFNDGDVIRVVANKPGWTSNNAETTVGVDTSGLDKAITDGNGELDKRNDGTQADKDLEKAIQEGENLKTRTKPAPATQEEINAAKDKIEKAIEEKKASDKALDELKKAQKELDKSIKDAEKERKPKKDIEEAKDTNTKAKDTITNKDKNSDEIERLIKEVEEKTKQMKKPVIQVTIISAVKEKQTLVFNTNPGSCKVTITIYYANGGSKEYIVETAAGGTGSKKLDKELQVGDSITIEATRQTESRPVADYLDGFTETTVY